MGAAVAVIIRRQRDIVEVFQGARATSPATARDPNDLGIDEDRIFRGLVDRAVIREAGNGRYYLDEFSWEALGKTRRRGALIVFLLVALLFGLGMFFTAARV